MSEQHVIDQMMNALKEAADEIGSEMVHDAVAMVSEPYPPASEPGQPPRRRSGALAGSFSYVTVVDEGSWSVSVQLSSAVEYAIYLEYGTDRMAPRPFWEFIEEYWGNEAGERISSVISSFDFS